MDALKVLEEKLVSLAELTKKLHGENKELKRENAELAEENAQQAAELLMLKNSLKDDCKKIDEFKKEKELARLAVDDLIKSIEEIVENQS